MAEEADVDATVAAARAAFRIWSSKPPSERAAVLHKFADLIEAYTQELAHLETLTSGKPRAMVLTLDLKVAAQYFRCEFHAVADVPMALLRFYQFALFYSCYVFLARRSTTSHNL